MLMMKKYIMNITEEIYWFKGFLDSLLYSNSISNKQIEIFKFKSDELLNNIEIEYFDFENTNQESIENNYDEDDIHFEYDEDILYNIMEYEPPELQKEDFENFNEF